MAKKKRVNKTKVIREYLDDNPVAMPADVARVLKERGIDVTTAQVSNVKYRYFSKRAGAPKGTKKKKRTGAKKSASRRSAGITAQDLIDAKNLADQLGGIDEAKQALETLQKLR